MNYATLLVWSAICLFVIWLIFAPFANAVDYFPNTTNLNKAGGWTHTPIVCLDNPPDKFNALRAAKSWELAFQERLQSHQYDYRILIVDVWDDRCNILMTFEDPNNIWKGTSHVGAIACWKYDDGRFCRGAINPEYIFWYNALVHELGHAWGIGHRNSFEKEGFAFVVLQDDIMLGQSKKFESITIDSIDALHFFYNYNGWNGALLSDYTIPHD